jgi:hypothetical protein
MEDRGSLEESLQRVVRCLRNLDLKFHLTGGIVSWAYGEPRFTQDLDLVIQLNRAETDRVAAALEQDFHVDKEAIEEAVRLNSVFQALDKETLIKIDFHVGEAVPGELGRTVWLKFSGEEEYPVVSKEDALLSKLLWIEKGSHKSRADVIGMLLASEPFDKAFVRSMAAELGVEKLFDRLNREADLDSGP